MRKVVFVLVCVLLSIGLEARTPMVSIEIGEVSATTVEATFIPNDDCASYWYMIGTESDMSMYEQIFASTLEQLVQAWGIHAEGTTTYTWTEQEPDTEYTIYVVPIDTDDQAYDVIVANVTTLAMGGTGEAIVDISVQVLSETSATIHAVPNSESAEYHYGFITIEYYEEVGAEDAPVIFREDGYPYYDESEFTWINLDPGTCYYALATAKNANGVWGRTTLVEACTGTTGIVESVNTYSIYPNPADDFVVVNGENVKTVAVYDESGRIVESLAVENAECRIDTKSYESGVYFVKIGDGKAIRISVLH